MRRLSLVMTILVFAFLFVPLVFVVVMSFHPGAVASLPLPGLSLRWYRAFLADTLLIRSLFNSFGVALSAALGAGILGTACALALVRYSFPGKDLFNALVLSPMVISRIILGVALLSFLYSVKLPRGYVYLLIGHIVITLPYVTLVVSSQLYGLDRRIEESALTLGANRIQTFFEVTMPLIFPGILAAMMFAFTISFQDVEASMLWSTQISMTMPVRIYLLIRDELTPKINVIAVIMIVLSVGLPVLAEALFSRRGTRQRAAAQVQ